MSFFCGSCKRKFKTKGSFIGHFGWCNKNRIVKKYECMKCGRLISENNIDKHVENCDSKKQEIQKEHKCRYCGKIFENGLQVGGHTSACRKNPNLNFNAEGLPCRKPRTLEQRQHLSKMMRNYLEKNPDKVPYLQYNSRVDSYPEKYFQELFLKMNIKLQYHYRVSYYELDFADVNLKIDIEIDGNQHYTDKKIIVSDKRRSLFLESLGWTIIRIKWADWKRKTFEQRSQTLEKIKNALLGA